MRFTRIGLVFMVTFLACPLIGTAGIRPKLQVVFELDEPAWAGKLRAEGHSPEEFNDEAAAALVDVFAARIGFIDFTTAPTPPFKLKVSIVRQTVAPGVQFIPTKFKLEYLGLPPGTATPVHTIPFRKGRDYPRSVTYKTLLTETTERMQTRLDSGTYQEDIVAKLLSHVSIVDHVHVIKSPDAAVAVIPRSTSDLRIATDSKIIMKEPGNFGFATDHQTKVLGPVTAQLLPLLSQAYAHGLVLGGQTLRASKVSTQPQPAQIIGLHVTLYIRADSFDEPTPPSEFTDE